MRHGKPTSATVIEKLPKNHRSLRCTCKLPNGTAETIDRAGAGNPYYEDVQVGDTLVAVYLPGEGQCALGEPRLWLYQDIQDFGIISLLSFAFIFFILPLLMKARGVALPEN